MSGERGLSRIEQLERQMAALDTDVLKSLAVGGDEGERMAAKHLLERRLAERIAAKRSPAGAWVVYTCANYHRFAIDAREDDDSARCAVCGTSTIEVERAARA
jgi:hypothetical protein